MVLINVKLSEEDQFFYSTSSNTKNDDLRKELIQLTNRRKRLQLITIEANELVKFGPMKNEIVEEDLANRIYISSSKTTESDTTTIRTGEAVSEDVAKPILRAIGEANALISKENVKLKTPLTLESVQNSVEEIKKSILSSPVLLLQGDDILKHFLLDDKLASELEETTTTIWWANKELIAEEMLSKFIGKNEKTTIVVKFSKKGQGAPPREAASDSEQKAMMAYYHKKQEEHNKLMATGDDSYLNSSWADSRTLRSAFTGTSNISWKP